MIPRVNIDERLNDHGRAFLGFLLQVKMCVLNGRICPINDSFTSISHRGKAVVDYIAVQHHILDRFHNFEVITMTDIMTKFELQDRGITRISDHSVLNVCMKVVEAESCSNRSHNAPMQGLHNANPAHRSCDRSPLGKVYNKPPTKYKKGVLPNVFMQSDERVNECMDLIEELLTMKREQEEVDKVYHKMVTMYHAELSSFLKELKPTQKSKRKLHHTKKPYWERT